MSRDFEIVFVYMTNEDTVQYVQYRKVTKLPSIEDWWIKVLNLVEMDKPTILLKKKSQ